MFYNCDRRNNRDEVEQQMGDQNEASTNSENTAPAENVSVLTPTNDVGNANSNEEIGENNINGESSNDIPCEQWFLQAGVRPGETTAPRVHYSKSFTGHSNHNVQTK